MRVLWQSFILGLVCMRRRLSLDVFFFIHSFIVFSVPFRRFIIWLLYHELKTKKNFAHSACPYLCRANCSLLEIGLACVFVWERLWHAMCCFLFFSQLYKWVYSLLLLYITRCYWCSRFRVRASMKWAARKKRNESRIECGTQSKHGQIAREKKHNRAYIRNMLTGIAYKNGKRCVCVWWSALGSLCVGARRRYYRFSELNESMSFPFSCRTPFSLYHSVHKMEYRRKKKQTNKPMRLSYALSFARAFSLSRGILHFMYNAK